MSDSASDQRLKAAFAARVAAPSPDGDCPEAGLIWDAATGAADLDTRMKVLDHVTACTGCAQDWQIARELHGDAAPVRARQPLPWMRGSLAAAASLVVVVGAVLLVRNVAPPDASYRGGEQIEQTALIEVKPRDLFDLEWPATETGARYTLRLFDASLTTPLFEIETEQTQVRVPAASLQSIAPGEHVIWQLQVRTASGERKRLFTREIEVR